MILLLIACASEEKTEGFTFPDPSEMPPLRGPGGPAVAFADAQLWAPCAYLNGNEDDWDHHNLVMPYRGHLVMPWAAEWGGGGLSFWEVDDPCAPVKIGETWETTMRETHAIGFMHLPEGDPHAGDWAVVNQFYGIQFWDISDPTAPAMVANLDLPDVFWPDAYARVALSVFWQYPYVYVAAADNGVFVVDATDPTAPTLLTQYVFDAGLRAGGVFAIGDVLLVTTAEQTQAALLDISIPDAPTLYANGLFSTTDADGVPKETYHGNLAGSWAMFARKQDAGGPIVYDIADPTAPTRVADAPTTGNGGYVFYDEGYLFVGESDIARVYSFDGSAINLVGEGDLEGDLDTIVPYGNVAILSVDEDAVPDQASAVMPWRTTVDADPPVLLHVVPADGATGVPTSSRIGLGFSEPVEPTSVFAGSVRLYDADDNPIDGWGTAQENTGTYTPKAALKPGMTYRLEVLAGGVRDINGNALAETQTFTFTTAGG